MIEDSKMNRLSALGVSVSSGALFRAAILSAAGVIAATTPADAALYYWRDSEPGFYGPIERLPPPRRPQRARAPKKHETKVKEPAVHPQMPLVIAVSIGSQRVKVYDANGLFAEAPVSTGMPGHPTPMGVFSVIEKDRYHHSNIYSGAPMPFMQRITWGGVALHAGVLPGYPASHGCIRMPNDFATKMWGWTKMGARVFVTPGEIPAPVSFSHPFLAAYKIAPQPIAVEPPADPDAKVGPKADLGAPEIKAVEGKLDLRPTVGHDKPAEGSATRTADAGSKGAVTMTDASGAAPREADAAKPGNVTTGEAKPEQPVVAGKADGDDAKPEHIASTDVKADDKPEPKADEAPKPVETPKSEARPEAAKADVAKSAEKPADKVKTTADDVNPAKKDETRIMPPAKAAKEPAKRAGQIAVFISRKDSKLYVRQNLSPLFDVPVTIAASERPLGTHVFTAQVDKDDSNVLHWSVVTVPMSSRALRGEDRRERVVSRKHKGAPPPPPVEAKPQVVANSPAEALDRITAPPEAMTRIAEALTTGGSIIVSDQGINQGETGEGTDFILSLR
jgi:lipoprotein-anchoring transpeptidase ErfK/SrfK